MEKRGFSNSLYVAELRYIQSIHEKKALQNPDGLVGQFLPLIRRWRCRWLTSTAVASLRADPFYYYLLARTKHYDSVFVDAVSSGMECIINIGCGTDTRAYRFEDCLKREGVRVVECDQAAAIQMKQVMVRSIRGDRHVSYLSVDLNDEGWTDFEYWVAKNRTERVLVLMEGVSPYINAEAFTRFLRMLSKNLSRGSRLAYDFKIRGIADEFGRGGHTERPFRLGSEIREVDSFHEGLGYHVRDLEWSAELAKKLLGSEESWAGPLFAEDALVKLEVK